MLAFITPLRGRHNARDFDACRNSLEVTVRQALRASNGLADVYVGTSDPGIAVDGATVVEVNDAPRPRSRRDMLMDKAVKRVAAIHTALEQKEYDAFVMLDSDDLVSRNYVDYFSDSSLLDKGGTIVDGGYLLDLYTGRLQRRSGLNHYCGSTLILTRALLEHVGIIRSSWTGSFTDYDHVASEISNANLIDFLGNHKGTAQRAAEAGFPLSYTDKPLITWIVNNGNNESKTLLPYGSLSVTDGYIDEFGATGIGTYRASPLEKLVEQYRYIRSKLGARRQVGAIE